MISRRCTSASIHNSLRLNLSILMTRILLASLIGAALASPLSIRDPSVHRTLSVLPRMESSESDTGKVGSGSVNRMANSGSPPPYSEIDPYPLPSNEIGEDPTDHNIDRKYPPGPSNETGKDPTDHNIDWKPFELYFELPDTWGFVIDRREGFKTGTIPFSKTDAARPIVRFIYREGDSGTLTDFGYKIRRKVVRPNKKPLTWNKFLAHMGNMAVYSGQDNSEFLKRTWKILIDNYPQLVKELDDSWSEYQEWFDKKVKEVKEEKQKSDGAKGKGKS
ncbi:hypothetical protein F5879DRAFT_924534 [Lentinula edodes]|nr:hypothetical protein F5879DRAFT_924534 [Lentinula edodes]